MTVKCTKCPTIIEDGDGRYNYPSGVQCNDCGEDYHDKHLKGKKVADTLSHFEGMES